jgi:hypothetical protein
MASTYSTNLALELIGTGDQSGTWGTTTNTNLGTLIEQAISGYVTQAITDGADTVITIPNGATGVARNMYIECTGALTANRNLLVPTNKKLYFIYNNTTGGYNVTVKVSGQTGVSVPNGAKIVLVSNGTDIVSAQSYLASLSLGSQLTVANGGTGVNTFTTAYGVLCAGTTATGSVQTLNSLGTSGQVLTSNGAAALPTWQTPSAGSSISNGTSNVTVASANGSVTVATNGTTALTINTSQNATFAGSATATALIPSGSSAPTNGVFLPASNQVAVSCNSAEQARFTTGKTLLIGTTATDGYGITLCGADGVRQYWNSLVSSTGNYKHLVFNNGNGEVGSIQTSGSGTNFNTSSDYRLKENIVPMTGALAKVAQLRPVTFTWKVDGASGQGFIAHELQAIVPECVSGEKDAVKEDGKPDYQSVDHSKLVATLTAAIQELKAEFDAYKVAHP